MTISQVAAAWKTMLVINSAMEPDPRQKLVVDTRARQRTTDFDPPWDFNQLAQSAFARKGNTIDQKAEIRLTRTWK